jgi:SAM-dependent methyltransferase
MWPDRAGLERRFRAASDASRGRRIAWLRERLELDPDSTVLDLGCWDGSLIERLLSGTGVAPSQVTAADVTWPAVAEARGHHPVLLTRGARLPFADASFDLVFCSSVLEHALADEEAWAEPSGRAFRRTARARQVALAAEIQRVGRAWFVQTPAPEFPLETHSWLPGVHYLPRRLLLPLLRQTNRRWIKGCNPNWALPRRRDLQAWFPGSQVTPERWMGLTKSWMVLGRRASAGVRSADGPGAGAQGT